MSPLKSADEPAVRTGLLCVKRVKIRSGDVRHSEAISSRPAVYTEAGRYTVSDGLFDGAWNSCLGDFHLIRISAAVPNFLSGYSLSQRR